MAKSPGYLRFERVLRDYRTRGGSLLDRLHEAGINPNHAVMARAMTDREAGLLADEIFGTGGRHG